MNWKDTTPRSQQDPDKPASCWTLETKKLRITVLNSHKDDPGEWVVSCHQVNFSVKRLGIRPESIPELARIQALLLVKKELREMLESLEGIAYLSQHKIQQKMRTQQEIDRQINGLLEIKKTLPERSKFGDSNWEGIDAQIEILKGNKTDEDFEDDGEFVFGQARDAQDWFDGNENGDLFE